MGEMESPARADGALSDTGLISYRSFLLPRRVRCVFNNDENIVDRFVTCHGSDGILS